MKASGEARRRWSAQPWRAASLRLLVYALPVVGSLAFVRVATAVTGVPTRSLGAFLVWWLLVSLCATAVVAVLYSLTRRLLPLGALLELSLVFPDEAPSRFKLAMRSGTVKSLEERLRRMREARETPSAQEAAELLLGLVEALDAHDRITRGHAERVRGYASGLGRQLGLSADELDRLNWAALLHDIGKLEVSTAILNKPGRPTEAEWETLRIHPLYGETMVEPLREWLGEWSDAVGYHHEHWDGSGYPRGVEGEQIPLAGRIVAIADVYDVITSRRSYKEPATAADARSEIARCSGTQFDPRLVRAFVNISLGRMRFVLGPLSWLSHAPVLARLPLTPSVATAFGGLAALATAATLGVVVPDTAAQAVAPAGPGLARTGRTEAPRAVGHVSGERSKAPRPSLRLKTQAPRRAPLAAPAPPPALLPEPVIDAGPPAPAPAPAPASASAPGPALESGRSTAPAPASPPAAPVIPPKSAPPPAAPPAPSPPPPPAPPPPTAPAPPPPAPPPAAPAPPPPPSPPPPNAAPAFTAGPSQAVLEDGGPQSVSGWATGISAGPPSESGQSVSFVVSSDNPGLFAVQPSVAPDGTLTYSTGADANGTATVTVTASDDGGTANGGVDLSAASTFTITAAAVNDAPSFAVGSNQTTISLLGSQSIPGWATGISPGPSESGQSVSFVVSSDNPGLFATQPAVAPDGTLTYTPALLALGTTTITVRATDDGGVANGGVDTSAPQTFTIVII